MVFVWCPCPEILPVLTIYNCAKDVTIRHDIAETAWHLKEKSPYFWVDASIS